MPEDLSYLLEKPSEEEERRIREAVEAECLRAIANYLEKVAETMSANGIEALNVPTLRAMSQEIANRLNNGQN